MKPLRTECPNCGATLSSSVNQAEIHCDYCHSSFANPEFKNLAKAKPVPPVTKPPAKSSAISELRPSHSPKTNPAPKRQSRQSATSSVLSLFGSMFAVVAVMIGMGAILVIFLGFMLLGTLSEHAQTKRQISSRRSASTVNRERDPRRDSELEKQAEAELIGLLRRTSGEINDRGEILSDAAGNEFLVELDPWGEKYRYEQVSERMFLIRSAGRDLSVDTRDDKWTSVKLAANLAAHSAEPISDWEDAKAKMRSPGYYDRSRAMDWIIESDCEIPKSDAENMVELAMEKTSTAGESGEKRLCKFLNAVIARAVREPEQASAKLEYVVRNLESGFLITSAQLASELASGDNVEQVELCYNLPFPEVYRIAEQYFDKTATKEALLQERCVLDLSDPYRFEKALSRIAEMDIAEDDRTEFGRRVYRAVGNAKRDPFLFKAIWTRREKIQDKDFESALRKLVTPENVDHLATAYEHAEDYTQPISNVLAEQEGAKPVQVLVQEVFTPGVKSAHSEKAVIKVGTRAEKYLWDELQGRNDYHKKRICEVLAQIGSVQSISHLQPLLSSTDHELAKAAREAIQVIQRVNRSPIS